MKAKQLLSAALLGVGLLGLVSACSLEPASPEDVGTSSEAVCANPDGTNAFLAALASSTGRETGRWLPSRDFQWNSSTGKLELSTYGKKRCADGKCFNTQELLNMQSDAATNMVVFPGGSKLNASSLRSRLQANLNAQSVCNGRPDNHTGDDCPVEMHQLTLNHTAPGPCDKFFVFNATQTDGVTPLAEPAQLKNQLIMFGYADGSGGNPYLSFQSNGSTVSIDPTLGLNEGDGSTTGSCTAACTLISATSVVGQCCSCNGATTTYSRSAWSASTYLCR
jgi:hypothetical protein